MHNWILGGAILAFAAVAHAEDSTATYAGRNADVSWRAEARARIERIRKATLKVQAVDAQGKPIRGAKVQVQQQRHAFGFGNILNPNAFQLEGEDGRMYREIFAEHFNKTTFESGFRWHNWYRPAREGKLDEHTKLLERMIRFCRSHDVGIRGHYLSWAPLSRDFYKPTDYRQRPQRLWPELSAHIDEMLAFTDGRLEEWDAVNHIVGWGDTMATVTGSNEIYAQIIRHARSKTDTPLWVNEGQILPGGGRVEDYEKIRRTVVVEGMSQREAARTFGPSLSPSTGFGSGHIIRLDLHTQVSNLGETDRRGRTHGVSTDLGGRSSEPDRCVQGFGAGNGTAPGGPSPV